MGNYPVALFQAEELAHVVVVDDGAGTPHGAEAERVGGELHVLNGGGAGGVVLQSFDLVAASLTDHSNYYRRAEDLFALAADPSSGNLLVLPLGRCLQASDLRPRAGQLTAAPTSKDVEAPRLREPVVRGVHGALEDTLDKLPRHRIPFHAPHALARLYGLDHVHHPSYSIECWSGTAA